MPDHYIPNEAYDRLVDELLHLKPTLDPRGQIVEVLGEFGEIWPESCREAIEADEAAYRARLVR
ncbi:hypothetical protein [Nioella ostreopsis]|uniref:hypothetical protein n=1 Tax=Nioella ostreopsis TaxID=2448479 RepID=UPI000FD88575|nr:hypothetical protein [Nioella ostreopsis]